MRKHKFYTARFVLVVTRPKHLAFTSFDMSNEVSRRLCLLDRFTHARLADRLCGRLQSLAIPRGFRPVYGIKRHRAVQLRYLAKDFFPDPMIRIVSGSGFSVTGILIRIFHICALFFPSLAMVLPLFVLSVQFNETCVKPPF